MSNDATASRADAPDAPGAAQQKGSRRAFWSRTAAAALGGAMVALALPDGGLWPLAFVAYAPLLAAIRGQSGRRRVWLGWVAGFALHLILFYWIYHTLVTMSGLGKLVAVLGAVGFAAVSGLHQAAMAWVIEPLRLRCRAGWALGVPAVVVLFEYWFPHLFPYHVGNAFYDQPIWMQHADLGGVYAVSWTSMLVSSAVVEIGYSVRGEAAGGARARSAALAAALALVFALGYGAWRLDDVDSAPVERVWRALVVQPHIDVEHKKLRGAKRIGNYDKIVALTRAHLTEDTEAVVWPEGGFPFRMVLTESDREWLDASDLGRVFSAKLQAFVRELGRPFLVGSLRQPRATDRLRNSATLLLADGQLGARYDKRLLVPVGEYVPLRDTFPTLAAKVPGSSNMDAGEQNVLFDVDGLLVMPSICYEAVYPGFTRVATTDVGRADAIVNFTNDVWFGDTSAPELHLMVQVVRAVELRLPLIRSTNTGVTAFVDATGRIEARAPSFEPAVLAIQVPIRRVYSFYREWGDVFVWAVALVMAVFSVGPLRSRRRPPTPNAPGHPPS